MDSTTEKAEDKLEKAKAKLRLKKQIAMGKVEIGQLDKNAIIVNGDVYATYVDENSRSADSKKYSGVLATRYYKFFKEVKGSLVLVNCDHVAENAFPILDSVEGSIVLEGSHITILPRLKYIGKDARFTSSEIQKMPVLFRIGENACFANSQIEHLPELKFIGDNADFSGCKKLTTLSNLEQVGGNLALGSSRVTDLPKLKVVKGEIDFSDTVVVSLPSLEQTGDVSFYNAKLLILPKLKLINGKADFRDSSLKSVPMLKTIKGDLYGQEVDNISMPKLALIGGDALFRNAKNMDFAFLEYVSMSLDLEFAQNIKLPALKVVGQDLFLRGCDITELPELEEIGRDAYFNETIMNTPKLRAIDRHANFAFSAIKELPELTTIKGEARFQQSSVESLPKIREISGDAFFEDCPVKTLSSLVSVGGELHLDLRYMPNIDNLVQCQSIVIHDFNDGNATYKMSLEEFKANKQKLYNRVLPKSLKGDSLITKISKHVESIRSR